MRRALGFPRVPFLSLFLLLLAGGCSDGLPGFSAAPEVSGSAAIETDLRDPVAVLAAYADATNRRDFAAIAALLDVDFECIPGQAEFPGTQLEPWGRDAELAITANSFDPTFQCPCGLPAIKSLTIELTLQTIVWLSIDETRLLTSLQGSILLQPTNPSTEGWTFDTRLAFGLIRRGEFWRIRTIEEILPPPDLRDDLPPLPRAPQWCGVRALYAP